MILPIHIICHIFGIIITRLVIAQDKVPILIGLTYEFRVTGIVTE